MQYIHVSWWLKATGLHIYFNNGQIETKYWRDNAPLLNDKDIYQHCTQLLLYFCFL